MASQSTIGYAYKQHIKLFITNISRKIELGKKLLFDTTASDVPCNFGHHKYVCFCSEKLEYAVALLLVCSVNEFNNQPPLEGSLQFITTLLREKDIFYIGT